MVKVNLDGYFQGYEQKTIKKGDRAGQNFHTIKFINGFDTLEFLLFDDTNGILQKVYKLEPMKKCNLCVGIAQNSGNTSLTLVDITLEK